MSLWNRLFGPEHEDDPMRAIVAGAELVADSQLNQAAQVEAMRHRVDQMELLLEGLVRELEASGALDVSALKDQIARLDAMDGRADQRMDATVPRRLQE